MRGGMADDALADAAVTSCMAVCIDCDMRTSVQEREREMQEDAQDASRVHHCVPSLCGDCDHERRMHEHGCRMHVGRGGTASGVCDVTQVSMIEGGAEVSCELWGQR